MTDTTAKPPGLALQAGFGLIGWFVAAMFIRFTIPLGWFAPPILPITFLLAIPASWLLVEVIRRLDGTSGLLTRVSTMCIVALILDGIALVWFPQLYGAEGATLLAPAAWLLAGVGWLELAALLIERRV